MQFRELARARDECVGSGACNTSAPAMRDFDRMLVKIPEHTWGLAQAYFTVWHPRAVCCLATVSPDFDLGAEGCELPHFSSFPLHWVVHKTRESTCVENFMLFLLFLPPLRFLVLL